MLDYKFLDVHRNTINLEQSILHEYVEEIFGDLRREDFVEIAEITSVLRTVLRTTIENIDLKKFNLKTKRKIAIFTKFEHFVCF